MKVQRDFGRVHYVVIEDVLHKLIVVGELAKGCDANNDVLVAHRPAASNGAWSAEVRWSSENMMSPVEARAAGLL